jgi:hypothetical protein
MYQYLNLIVISTSAYIQVSCKCQRVLVFISLLNTTISLLYRKSTTFTPGYFFTSNVKLSAVVVVLGVCLVSL